MNIPELLVGGILGAVLGYLFPLAAERWKLNLSSRRKRRHESHDLRGRVYDWLLEYYLADGSDISPYSFEIAGRLFRVPFLTQHNWLHSVKVGADPEPLVVQAAGFDDLGHDRRLLETRSRVGQRLFNSPALYYRNVRISNARFQLFTGSCGYFDIATSLIRLENETYRCARSRFRKRNPKFRELVLGRDRSGDSRGAPFSVAASVALLMNTPSGIEILLHARSFETVTYGGMQAVIPYFGMMPVDPSTTRGSGWDADANIITNIIKEYCEELFSRDELIDDNSLNSVDAEWIFTLPEASELRSFLTDGKAELRFLGFGFDALNGSATLSFMLWIKDEAGAQSLRRRLNGNWEVDGSAGQGMRLFKLDGQTMAELFERRAFTYGSAFTVARVLETFAMSETKFS